MSRVTTCDPELTSACIIFFSFLMAGLARIFTCMGAIGGTCGLDVKQILCGAHVVGAANTTATGSRRTARQCPFAVGDVRCSP